MYKKLIFFDIDGTLVPDGSQCCPSEAVSAALKQLQFHGHKTFLCTGRTLCDIGPELRSIHFDGVIAGAGAYISLAKQCIFHNTISAPLLNKTVEQILACHVSCILEGTHNFYYAGKGNRKLPWKFPRVTAPDQLTGKESVEKFTAHVEDYREFECLGTWLQNYYEIYSRDDGQFFEMVIQGQNKATAIQWLCSYLNHPIKDTVAFGDGRNDIEMLRISGIGVAMGSAPQDVCDAADFITGPVEADGIPQALRYLGLLE